MTKAEYEAKNQELRDTYICDSDYFGRLVDVDEEYIASLEAENAKLEKIIGISARLLYHHMGSCPSDIYGWEHPRTCEIRCEEIDQPDGWVACWHEFLMQEIADGATQTPLPVSDATQEEEK